MPATCQLQALSHQGSGFPVYEARSSKEVQNETYEYEPANIVLPRMPRTLEPINTQTVHAHLLPREGMTDRHAFVDYVALGRVGRGGIGRDVGLDELDDWSG